MATTLQTLLARARALEDEIEDELEARRTELGLRIERGRAAFGTEIRARHRAARQRLRDYLAGVRPMVVLTAPVIYSMILPFVLVDLWVTLYQAICFPVYGIPRVRRRDHIAIDRGALGYLNGLQKLNCLYCGYGNGVASYLREVAGRTEAYWCPIKHARRVTGTHPYYGDFMDYGDEADFISRWDESRVRVRRDE